MKDPKMYLIRRKNEKGDYEYSVGGMDVRFTGRDGAKLWKTMGYLKSHLAQFVSLLGRGKWEKKNEIPEDWEVVEYVLVPTGVTYNARELYETADKGREEQRKLRQEREEAATKEQLIRNLITGKTPPPVRDPNWKCPECANMGCLGYGCTSVPKVPDRGADKEIPRTDVLYHDEPECCNMCGGTYPMSLVRVVCDGGPAKAWLCPCGHAHLAEWL